MKPRLVTRILERDLHQCVIDGPQCRGEATVADHRANRGHGGSNVLDDPRNLVASCRLCNGLKEDADADYRHELIRRGVRVLKAATNALTVSRAGFKPVEFPDGRWWFLHQDGTRTELTEVPF